LKNPLFKNTVTYRELEIKTQLLEAGWTLPEIERTDLDELMRLLAFRDAVSEHEDLEYYDEYTQF
ncbi:hypothetical protein NWO25_18590, partial [Enterococcus lactis]|nr:hypothetical protein [Enterococcus lactis]